MAEVIFRSGEFFEAAAFREDAFQSMDQVLAAARALEKAGFVRRVPDEQGGESYLIVRDITGADLAFVVSHEHKEMEEGR